MGVIPLATMGAPLAVGVDAQIERRFVRLARLARSVSTATDFKALAHAVAAAFEEPLESTDPPGVRL